MRNAAGDEALYEFNGPLDVHGVERISTARIAHLRGDDLRVRWERVVADHVLGRAA